MDRAVADTRIRRDYIVAMEADDFSFQAPVYVRGFLASYARFLRLDPAPLLHRFDDRFGALANEAIVLAEQNAMWTGAVRMPSAFRPLVITTCLLLLLTAATLWTRGDAPEKETRASTEVEADTSNEVDAAEADETKAAPVSSSTDNRRLDVRIAATTARSWVEVVAGDEVIFTGTLEVGDEHVIRTKRAVRITLGFPAGVELTVDGRNLGSPGGEDVVRLALPDDLAALT